MHDEHDDELLGALRRVVGGLDPVPDHVVAAAQAALGWRTVDDELAELLRDSTVEAAPAGVRSEDRVRVLSFRGESLQLELEVSGSGRERTLVGQIAPAGEARIEVRHGAGVLRVDADEHGRFTASAVPAGSVSLRCVAGGPRALATPWLPI